MKKQIKNEKSMLLQKKEEVKNHELKLSFAECCDDTYTIGVLYPNPNGGKNK